jgi:alpha-D-ribose 1-methylphosphonate 5-triphosphate diphosphatase
MGAAPSDNLRLMARQIFTNARVLTPDEAFLGTVELHAGRIVRVDVGATIAPGAEDLGGDYLLPGLVEIHTDNLEKHLEPRPGVRWPATSALLTHDGQIAAAGITTVLDAMGIGDFDERALRAEGLQDAVAALDRARESGLLRADHWLHLRCELPCDNVLAMTEAFIDHSHVRLVSLMDHTPGQRQWMNIEKFRVYTQRNQRWTEDYLAEVVAQRQDMRHRNAERNREALLALCVDRELAIASHDDTLEEHIHEGIEAGISISEFPTTEAAARSAREHGMKIVMGAPNLVRGGSHSGNVATLELARHDLLDALSSDYVPHALLHAAFLLHAQAGWTLPRAIATVSLTPARMVGFDDRGAIAIGQRADLVRVRLLDGVPVPMATWRSGNRIA